MAQWDNIDEWMAQHGIPPEPAMYNKQALVGPFFFNFQTSSDGSAKDLKTAAILTSDPKVERAYGTGAVPKAKLVIVRSQLVFTDDAFRRIGDDIKEVVYREYRLRAVIKGEEYLEPLGRSVREIWTQTAIEDTNTTVLHDLTNLQGHGPCRHRPRWEVDLERGEFTIPTTTTLAAAYNATLVVWGAMFNNNEARDPRISEQGCAPTPVYDPAESVSIVARQKLVLNESVVMPDKEPIRG